MGTELTTTNNSNGVQVHLGERDAIQQIRDRIVSMMPGAAEAPPDVVWAAAQLAVAHELNPFNGEIYIMSTGRKKVGNQWVDDYRAHVGVKGLRKKAREQAEFMTEFRDMTEDEVKRHRRGDYEPDDIGVECTLYRLDVAQTCARIGIPYKPVIAVGFWRKRAKYNKKNQSWSPDNTPNTWSDHQVAKKRAEINAIKEAFDLTLNVADPSVAGDENTVDVLSRRIESHDRDHAIPATVHVVDDDGIFAVDSAPDLPSSLNDVDPIDQTGANEPKANQPAPHEAIRAQLTDKANQFADWATQMDASSSDSACTEAQYRFLFSLFRNLAGKGNESTAMAVVFGREVSEDNRPGSKITKQLLDILPEARGRGDDKQANENYRADIAAIITQIGQMVPPA
jgi:hypothetical protein